MTTTTDAPGEPPAAPLPVAFRPGSPADRKSRFWRTVWRVNFYAGIFVIPFLVMLAVTGTLVLYEDPINDVTDHDLTYVEPQAGDPLPLDEQVARVEQAFPDFEVGGVTPPTDDGYSTVVALAVNEADVRNVYVNPYRATCSARRSTATTCRGWPGSSTARSCSSGSCRCPRWPGSWARSPSPPQSTWATCWSS